ncbi:cation diffusion facilitator family transporter [Clostridiales bacterium KA00134]|nr:cation diffusion facilitator family transporter [Clostridiales bacterium KA00134]
MLVNRVLRYGKFNTKDEDRMAISFLASLIGLLLNVFLAIIKLVIGLITGSVSILADSLNNMTDSASNIITALGIHYAKKPADKEHPHGHGRVEYIASLVVSSLVLSVGIMFFKSSFLKIKNPERVFYTNFQISIMIFSIFAKLGQAHFYNEIGEKIKFSPLKALGKDSLNDVLSTGVVVVSIIIEKFSSYPIDGIGGILVSIFIIYSGFELIRDCVSELIGKNAPREFIDELKKRVLSYDEILGVHDIIINNFGPQNVIVVMDVEVPFTMELVAVHSLIERIQREVGEALDAHIVIHIDPIGDKNPIYYDLSRSIMKVLKDFDWVISFHDLLINKDVIHLDIVLDGEKIKKEEDVDLKKREIISKLLEERPGYRFDVNIDRRLAP